MKYMKRYALTLLILVAASATQTSPASGQIVTPNKPPLLVYPNPQSMLIGGTLSVKPRLGPTDNTNVASLVVSSVSPATFTGNVTVDGSGKVTITNPGTVGVFTVAIRAIDSQGAITIARFRLRVRTVECSLYRLPVSLHTEVGSNTLGPGVGDFNNDGNIDVIIIEVQANGISLLLGDGTGNFSEPPNSFTGGLPGANQVEPADFNRDGRLDLAIRKHNGFFILLGDGMGNFNLSTDITIQTSTITDLTVGDFNNDGRPDVAFTEREPDPRIHIYLNKTLLGFKPATGSPKPLINSPFNIESRDFNNDGNVDLAVQVAGSNVFTYLGDGTGGFAGNVQLQFPLLPGGLVSMTADDLNHDGNDDLAIVSVAQTFEEGTFEVHLGIGTGAFTSGIAISTDGNEEIGLISTDFNLDGNRDLIAGLIYAASFATYQNDGNGIFTMPLGGGPGVSHSGLHPAAEDFNNDGQADIVSVNYTGQIDVMIHGSCAPTFNPAAIEISRCDPPVLKTLGTIISDDFPINQLQLSKELTPPGMTITNLTTSGNQVVGLVDAADSTPLGAHQLFVRVMRPDIDYLWDAGFVAINVVDCAPPPPAPLSLAQPPDVSVSSTPDTCGAVVNYNLPQVTGGAPPVSVVCTPESGSLFPIGSTSVSCTATDSAGNQASTSFNVNVEDDQAPQLVGLSDIVVNAPAGQCSAIVNFNVTATDNCAGAAVTTNPLSGSSFPEGTTQVTATATDAAGNVTTGTFNVTVIASGAGPTITDPVATPNVLGPPNHKMKNVNLDYTVTPGCGGPVTCVISVSSNEPVDGTGDGDVAPDWEIVNPHRVRLRAERSGSGSGRIYTITITCTDASGNQATRSVTVTVPL